MKRLAFVAALLIGLGAIADRTITAVWLSTSVTTTQVQLNPLPDGGCIFQIWANVTQDDGGVVTGLTSIKELSGANQTTCLNIMSAGKTLFKNDQGL